MAMHPRAGQKAQQEDLHNIPALVANYFLLQPDAKNPDHKVQFGTSGHRGTADKHTFNENHILAIAQAVAEVRDVPACSLSEPLECLYMGKQMRWLVGFILTDKSTEALSHHH